MLLHSWGSRNLSVSLSLCLWHIPTPHLFSFFKTKSGHKVFQCMDVSWFISPFFYWCSFFVIFPFLLLYVQISLYPMDCFRLGMLCLRKIAQSLMQKPLWLLQVHPCFAVLFRNQRMTNTPALWGAPALGSNWMHSPIHGVRWWWGDSPHSTLFYIFLHSESVL